MTSAYDYQLIESLLLRLLSRLLDIFTDSEKVEVQSLIDSGEYGLAMETLIDILIEEKKEVSDESLTLVCGLAAAMKLDKKVFEEKLRSNMADD